MCLCVLRPKLVTRRRRSWLRQCRSDLELAAGIARRDAGTVRLVMRRNNQRLFRAAWRILRNREDAEDAVQSGYLKAFAAIRSFAGRSSLSTWLTRIVTNNALAHVRAARRRRSLLEESEVPILDDYREMLMRGSMSVSPERAVARSQIRQTVADAIDQLPAPFRKVFVLRQIEDLDVAEVAESARHSGGHRQDKASARAAAAPASARPGSQRRIVGQVSL